MLQQIPQCSPDKQADIAVRVIERQQRIAFWIAIGNALEDYGMAIVIAFTLAVLFVPGINAETTKWYQSIGWLTMAPQLDDAASSKAEPVLQQAEQDQSPTAGETVAGYKITSIRENRLHPTLGYVRPHEGIDVATPVGTPIILPADATVECGEESWGTFATIRFPNLPKDEFILRHLSTCTPSGKQPDGSPSLIAKGQVVATTGTAGTGPHLHIEQWQLINGRWKDFDGQLQEVDNEWKPIDVSSRWITLFLKGQP